LSQQLSSDGRLKQDLKRYENSVGLKEGFKTMSSFVPPPLVSPHLSSVNFHVDQNQAFVVHSINFLSMDGKGFIKKP
jgi:hypothetical protein